MKSRTKPVRRRGYTRLSAKGQVTIPKEAIIDKGWSAGDEFRIEITDDRIVLIPMSGPDERWHALVDEAAGSLTGVYEHGYLDKLRDEWR